MIRAKKSFGQHFLRSPSVLAKIIAAAEIKKGETVLEIGPGTGVLTRALLDAGARVIAVEADRDLIPFLQAEFGSSITLLSGDAMQFLNSQLLSGLPLGASRDRGMGDVCAGPPTARNVVSTGGVQGRQDPCRASQAVTHPSTAYKLIANLPYNIASAVLQKFLTEEPAPSRLIVMVQREVGERILAKPGEMSMLSLACQLYADCRRVTNVPRGAFSPPPKVESMVVRLDRAPKCANPEAILRLAAAGFHSRRKQLHRTLADAGLATSENVKAWLRSLGLPETARAQELSVDNWLALNRLSLL